MYILPPVLHLAMFGSGIPRAFIVSNKKINEVLEMAQVKSGVQGMQQLAVELQDRDLALGNEIVASSPACIQVSIAEFKVELGFTELSFIQIDLCVLCVFVLYSRVPLSSCPFWTFCTASPARWECL